MERDLSARLSDVPTGTAAGILHKLGVDRVVMSGIRPITSKNRVAGPARTLRFLPIREDVKAAPRGRLNWDLIDKLQAGEIIVMDAMGVMDGAVLGDIVATRVHLRGGTAIVIDGVTRDAEGIEELGLPVYARGTHPGAGSYVLWPWEIDGAIQCGGVFVESGDYIIADRDSVVVLPKALAEEVALKSEELALEEEFALKLLRSGSPLSEVYPLPPSRRSEFEQFRRERTRK
jgi:regulator of RNase E activity RraA